MPSRVQTVDAPLDTPEVCLEELRNGTPPFSNPEVCLEVVRNHAMCFSTTRGTSGGPQTGANTLGTPRSVRRGLKIRNPENVSPEVCLEVVPNVEPTFGSTRGGHQMLIRHLRTPRSVLAIRRKWDRPKSGVFPRSILAILQKWGIPKNGVPRGPSFRFRKILNQGRPEEDPRTT